MFSSDVQEVRPAGLPARLVHPSAYHWYPGAAIGLLYQVSVLVGLWGSDLPLGWKLLATGLSFLAWYVFAPQCASTFGVVKRETNSWLWPIVMLVYMTALAYAAAFAVYHTAAAFGLG